MAGYKREVRSGVWRLEYMFNGDKYSKNIKAKTELQADKALALFIADVENQVYTKTSGITFVEFAQLYIDKYANDNTSPSTLRNYKNQLNKYILKEFGTRKLNTLKRIEMQEFANKLVKEYNLSSKTAKNYLGLISSILNKAVEWEYVNYNVADKVNIPKNLSKPKKKVVLYSYDEIIKFTEKLKNLENRELQLAIYTSLYTGCRRSEVCGLTFKDFNFEKNTIYINKARINTKGGTIVKDTKTGKERMFYIPQNYVNDVKKYYIDLGSPNKNTKLFNMHPDTFSNNFKQFLLDNELREINLKDLRALNESILVNKGMDIVSTAKRLGHLPSTATNYYLDQIPEEDKKASEILQNLL